MATVLVPLAQGCEELEAVTIVDLLRRAGIDVTTAGLDDQPVTASRGVKLIPDTALAQAILKKYDMIVLPGGLPGADHLDADPRITEMLHATLNDGGYAAAVCAAPKVLASAGLLKGKRATGYPGVLDATGESGIDISGDAIVKDGKVITSRGPGTAMDFALELIATLMGTDKRDEVERGLVRPD